MDLLGERTVRVCGADRCALRFLDRSPARNRRWCSMSRCGNRTKVRLHQARTTERPAQGKLTRSPQLTRTTSHARLGRARSRCPSPEPGATGEGHSPAGEGAVGCLPA
ncbi:CGNR zinc finger domain-containing protein [Streptomyces sp. NBC_00285]|uniref:CGNR zinc finger domain-containing protein n=1 Tax=Streptomyces sp. NBC_00285 TaxID=2975700 RepID=UPI003FA6B4C9